MADQTQETTQTRISERQGPTGHHRHDEESAHSTAMGGVSLAAGILGVIAGIVPLLGAGALILAVIAFATGIPSMRHGPRAPGFRYARIGVVLAVIAVVLGLLNLAIQLDLFDFFTADSGTVE